MLVRNRKYYDFTNLTFDDIEEIGNKSAWFFFDSLGICFAANIHL